MKEGSDYLTPIPRTTVVDEIVKRLVGLILEAGLKPGDKLPAERELMARLAVGRSSLREAIRTLSAIGVIEISQRKGIFVGDGQTSLLTRPLSWHLLMNEHTTNEVIEARRVVETELAALAAQRATEQDILTIGQRLSDIAACLDDASVFGRHDLAYHMAIAAAARSRVLYHVLETLQHVIRVWILQTVVRPEVAADAILLHEPIYRAICARDPKGARQAMATCLNAGAEMLWSAIGGKRPPASPITESEVFQLTLKRP